MNSKTRCRAAMIVGVLAIALSSCDYVRQDQYDATISDLHSTDQKLQSQIDALSQRLDALSQKYDVIITQMAGRIRVDTGAHFATGDANLREDDKPFLADFAKVMSSSHSEALVTVEGFADSQGSTTSNRRLGMRRAISVVDFLQGNGMNSSQLRAVSYGEDSNRQVRAGAIGAAGQDNRRVSLVVDYAGHGSSMN